MATTDAPAPTRRGGWTTIGRTALWGAVAVLGATIVALVVRYGLDSMPPLVPLFAIVAVGAAMTRPPVTLALVASYTGLGLLFGFSHGFVLYAAPLMWIGAGLLWAARPSASPE